MIAWLNGEFVEDPQVSAADRGFLLGDGAFETIYVERGRCAFLAEHLARLASGLETLRIARPDMGDIGEIVAALAARNAIDGRAAARLTVTRGAGERGLRFSGESPTALATIAPLAPPASEPLRVIVSQRRRFALASTGAFKAVGGYVENFLAHNEALAASAGEALMLNEHGRLASAAAANVFILTEAGIATPTVEEGAMPGVVRGLLLRHAAETGSPIIERPIEPLELQEAPVFLSNSLIGVRPATLGPPPPKADERFRVLQSWYQRRLEEELARGAA